MRTIGIIAAVSKDRGIYGAGNSLPWPALAKDMEVFKNLTTGNIVIMGRSTFESLPEKYKPLPNRINIVVSSKMKEGENFYNEDKQKVYYVCKTIEGALNFALTLKQENIFFIGGREIWLSAIKYCNTAFITVVSFDCDQIDKFLPLNFAYELLIPEIIFEQIGKKKYKPVNQSWFVQKILDKNNQLQNEICGLIFLFMI